MKTILSFGFWLMPILLMGQVVDTTEVSWEVDSLIKISRTLTENGDFDKALEVNTSAENLVWEKLGHETASYGSICYNYGRIFYFMDKMPEAEKWYLESKDVLGKTLGKEHPKYAWVLNNLGNFYHSIGLTSKAESLQLEAKAIREKVLGKEHPDYALSLYNLAITYSVFGDHEKAELLFFQSKAIYEKVLGKAHPDYALSVFGLGSYYEKIGNYKKAIPFYLEAKDIYEKTFGNEHHLYTLVLNGIGCSYLGLKDYQQAESYWLEAYAIREKKFGKTNFYSLETLSNLVLLYKEIGNYEKSESLLLFIVNTLQEKSNQEAEYALALYSLADLNDLMGNYEKSESLFLESLNIQERILGKNHRDYQLTLKRLALFYFKQGQYVKSIPRFDELNSNNISLLTKSSHHMSERELNDFLPQYSIGQDRILSMTHLPNIITGLAEYKTSRICYNNILFYKGYFLYASNRIKSIALSDSITINISNELNSCRRNLAAEYTKPIAERKNVAELEEKANTLEKELVRTVAGYGEAIRQVNWQEVQAALKPGEAAIEFVHYQYYMPDPTDSIMYAALILRPLPAGDSSKAGGDTHPTFVPLFEERQLAPLLRGLQSGDFTLIDKRYAFLEGQNTLNTLIWQPLDTLLQGVKTVYCSPSGLLHRVNLDAIPINSKQTFADRYQLVLVGSTRQLVVGSGSLARRSLGEGGSSGSGSATLFGGIEYNSKTLAVPAPIHDPGTDNIRSVTATAPAATASATATIALPFPYDTTLRGGGTAPWKPLRATETEVRNIATMLQKKGFQTQLQTGPTATEESFKQLGKNNPSPHILHLATHGYFFPDPKENKNRTNLALDNEPVFKLSDHPMIRAGLILAGANQTWTTGTPPAQGEDGILTAYEISQMNLSNTELVVLSACETGLGDLVGNEGVYGLQRAFKIAGAKYLIMSLWQVSDRMTGELMTEFYRQYLEEKKPVPDAFRGAQRAMREKYPGSASAWAGFVLIE